MFYESNITFLLSDQLGVVKGERKARNTAENWYDLSHCSRDFAQVCIMYEVLNGIITYIINTHMPGLKRSWKSGHLDAKRAFLHALFYMYYKHIAGWCYLVLESLRNSYSSVLSGFLIFIISLWYIIPLDDAQRVQVLHCCKSTLSPFTV